MATFAIGEIPNYFNTEFFKRTLENGLRTGDLKILGISIENLTMGGENYCSNIYRAIIKYKSVEDQQHEQTVIIKNMPKQKQGVLSRLNIYRKETIFYLDIKPKVEALMWYLGEPWNLAARHFHSTTEPEQNIVFEDLSVRGFTLESRQAGLDLAHARIVMKKLGEYHALTMVMAEREPDIIIDHYTFGLLNTDSIKTVAFKALFGAQLLKLATLISEYPDLEAISKKLLKYYDHFTERVLESIYPLRGEVNVLNHGDLWVNNLFFKYDSKSLKFRAPSEVRFIDFQLCYYGSIGFDINYFLNTSVQLDVLKNDRESLIETYYDSLMRSLKGLPYVAPLPKFTDVLREIAQREAFGFFVAFGFFPLMSMFSMDSHDNSLEKFYDEEFARRKIELMFQSNPRTMETLKYALKRFDDLKVLD
ncbi:uncharacterized protein LOC129239688 [Anastrepha obliqua]|uniref:uncharacterized protein LOC129239688 n=1 Tax=Anastrepha obliqua TaxID=95512 RepID=UPI00240998D3|nr:uncharacterized protein LOC129239688 [Anastrepha obliqua]